MKMKVLAIHIVLTSHSSAEGKCFFMRNKKECKFSEGPRTSTVLPSTRAPSSSLLNSCMVGCIQASHSTKRARSASESDCCGVSILGGTPDSARYDPEQPDLALKLHLTLKLAVLWVGVWPGDTERSLPLQDVLWFSLKPLKLVPCAARATQSRTVTMLWHRPCSQQHKQCLSFQGWRQDVSVARAVMV